MRVIRSGGFGGALQAWTSQLSAARAMSDDHDDEEGHPAQPDVRFSYANERTFLAWIRTALGLVTAGLAVVQLLPPFNVPGGRRILGLPLIAVGVLVALFSFRNWQRNEQAMRTGQRLPASVVPRVVALVVAAVAVAGLVLVLVGGSSR